MTDEINEPTIEAQEEMDVVEREYENVRNINGISYINDGAACSIDETKHALDKFGNIYWILGGKAPEDSGSNILEGLENHINKVQHAFVCGASADEIIEWLDRNGVENTRCVTLENAVNLAHGMAQSQRGLPGSGNTILFSPACQHGDNYQSLEHRKKAFGHLVQDLSEEVDE